MFMLPAELLYATRTLAQSQLAGCNAWWHAAFESGAGLLDAHVHAARAHLAAAQTASDQLLRVREPGDLIGLTARESQQALERAQRYGRRMAGVANALHSRLGELNKDFAGTLPRTSLE